MDGKLKPLDVDVQVGGYTLMIEARLPQER